MILPLFFIKKGNIEDAQPKISIVGTRNMTAYGKQFIENFLKQHDPQNIHP